MDPVARFHPVGKELLAKLRWKQNKGVEAIPTPSSSWNRACRGYGGGEGLALSWYVLLTALTGLGKTLLALGMTRTALENGYNVLYVSLEQDWDELITRLRSIVTGGNITEVEPGKRHDPEKAKAADDQIIALPGQLHVNTEPIWRLQEITDVIEAHADAYDVRMVIVDYCQLVSPAGDNTKLFQRMSEVSSRLRYAAKNHELVTVALSQMNRSAPRDESPSLGSLFGSSRLEFDADQILALDHSRREVDEVSRIERTWLTMIKNRHGPQIEVPVALDKRNLRIREAMPDEEGEWPGMDGLRRSA